MDRRLLDRLLEHQKTIRALAARGLALLQAEEAPDAAEIGRLRWNMVRVLTEYQQFKHREIFDPALAGEDAHLARMATAMKADCTALGDAFTAYVRTWTARGTSGHWAEYRAAALAMQARIARHLEREEGNVAALFRAARLSRAPVWPVRPG